ncbi:MAG: hypothetical protein WEB88_02600 [Gemmatimonadota bacterium]
MSRTTVRVLPAVLAAFLCLPAAGHAQLAQLAPPHAEWRRLETDHFRVLYTADVERWTEWLAARMDGLYDAVTREVGFSPDAPMTIIVDDAGNTPGGQVLPFLSGPIMMLDPTPMEPRWTVAGRAWPEVLAAHELTHAVQSAVAGGSGSGLLEWLRPFRIGPIAGKAPRWLTEGFATLVEARLTGSNAAASVFRAAVLRTWGAAGRMPTYAAMNFSEEFLGANMAYLVGAAFLEHLLASAGDDAITTLLLRLAEPGGPDFDTAFEEVFGAPAALHYEWFRQAVSQRAALAVEVIASGGLHEGEHLHHFNWRLDGTEAGDPALSADGALLALAIRPADGAPRIELRRAADLSLLEALSPEAGRGHESPRFMPDGERVLLARQAPVEPHGQVHDLFLWGWRTGEVTRITHGAGVREADPSPDGRSAVGVRMTGGITDLVRVDLATGTVVRLATGSPERILARPRWAPDGQSIVVGVQVEGRARIALVNPAGGELRYVDPVDGVNRYDPAFAGPDRLLVVSEAGGVANVTLLNPATGGEQPLTRLITGAFWPIPTPDDAVLFMALHPEGLDLRRVSMRERPAGRGVTLPSSLAPAVPARTRPLPELAVATAPPSRPYGRGTRLQDLLPGVVHGPEASLLTLTFRNRDLLRRLTWSLDGALGRGEVWRGASTTVVWRDRLPNLTVHGFVVEQRPSRTGMPGYAAPDLDMTYAGALVRAGDGPGVGRGTTIAAGITLGHLSAERGNASRATAFGRGGLQRNFDVGALHLALFSRARTEAGWTGGDRWLRLQAAVGLEARAENAGHFRATVVGGALLGSPDPFEHFSVGGPGSPLLDPDAAAQQVPMPALEAAARGGERMAAARVDYAIFGLPTAYVWATRTYPSGDHLTVVIGAEKTFFADDARLEWLIPGMSARLGGGMEITDSARRSRFGSFYLALSYRP